MHAMVWELFYPQKYSYLLVNRGIEIIINTIHIFTDAYNLLIPVTETERSSISYKSFFNLTETENCFVFSCFSRNFYLNIFVRFFICYM